MAAAAGGDHKHSVCCLGSVNCLAAGILKDVDRLYVGRVEVGNLSVIDDAVQHNQGVSASVDGRLAADFDGRFCTGTVGLGNLQTGNSALKGLENVRVGGGLYGRKVSLHNRTGEV